MPPHPRLIFKNIFLVEFSLAMFPELATGDSGGAGAWWPLGSYFSNMLKLLSMDHTVSGSGLDSVGGR